MPKSFNDRVKITLQLVMKMKRNQSPLLGTSSVITTFAVCYTFMSALTDPSSWMDMHTLSKDKPVKCIHYTRKQKMYHVLIIG